MRSIPESFYHSAKWKSVRQQYLMRRNYLCENCLAEGRIEPAREVHHVIHLTLDNYRDPKYAYNFDNLQALCHNCHNEAHGRREKQVERYKVDADGRVVILPLP